MPYQPNAGDSLIIGGTAYRIAEHPAAPGLPYGQEGRQAVVYQLIAGDERRALKVFKPRFRVPALAALAERLAAFAELPGLTVCRRTVLTSSRHTELLRQYPDLTYAVLMPWISGPTWMEVLLEGRALTPAESLTLARALAEGLAGMEERGIAHCDLSGPNLILPGLARSAPGNPHSLVELVDVEQLFGPGLERPSTLPGGSPGYAHPTAASGLWRPEADRLAGAVLLAELLGWCDPGVRAAAWGESYFDPQEIGRDGPRIRSLLSVLRTRWDTVLPRLLERAWASETLADCPTFGEWVVALPEEVPIARFAPEIADHSAVVTTMPRHGLLSTASLIEPSAGNGGETVAAGAVPSAQEVALAGLFEAGLAAYRAGDWARTRELLAEVVRQQPGYRRDGHRAVALLAEAERQLEAPPLRPWRRLLVPTLVLLGFLAVVAGVFYQMQTTATAQAQATVTAQAQATAATQVTSTARAMQAATAQAQATITTEAVAAFQTTQTAQTDATTTSETVAAVTTQAQTTSTAEAVAQEATVSAQTTRSAGDIGTAVVVAQTSIAAARTQATATAQAQADLAGQTTATAQAQADLAGQTTATAQAQAMQRTRTAQAQATARAIAAKTTTAQAKATGTAHAAIAAATAAARSAQAAATQAAHETATAVAEAANVSPDLAAPVQLEPDDGAVLHGYAPFKCAPVSGASGYVAEYIWESINNSGYSTPTDCAEGRSCLYPLGGSCTGGFAFPWAVKIRWRVWAVDTAGRHGPKSEWRTYTANP